jgi:UPF0755 protein
MRRVFWILFLVLVAAAGWLAASVYLPYQAFPADGVYVDIPHGASRRTISRILVEQGVVRNRWSFEALSRLHGHRTLEAGEYFFDHPVTEFQVFDTLAEGRVYVRELLIPEGYSMFDIADLVAQQGFTTREEFLAAAADPTAVLDIAPHAHSLEGFLFPATYEFPRHPRGKDMTAAMVKRFREDWAAIVAGNSATPTQSKSDGEPKIPLVQAITLASLVERETPKAEERPLVAGVFTNRLREGVPLQCDPTVVYAMELAVQYGGTLEASDLHFDSPYNTYLHTGLPPGPIANPGDASLRAALAPQPTDYLYFVANTEGGHFFSKTLAEHNRNVALYRERLAEEKHGTAAPRSP